uniref:peptidylprolyl isomerase n=1 Tax=Caligus rogercresseyi TaxID=217165 RepID=C1BPR8_CALRO|nr:FK506-binding protein 2 precursor [Caligus rogercresseyi]ACO11628.1 FK506-binding protein 2 precursor [Caligus rogercresseyi]|eukprot:TRINITY_DN129_c0_g1_i1.p2 TRINITY_DN129_c0_g1~~TRINITY_DN129_c0_g1_i1.p2  ORF type:complete len:152 (-),score=46.56 TRINITY_DN129_c0_g1_i1:732-1187(-)
MQTFRASMVLLGLLLVVSLAMGETAEKLPKKKSPVTKLQVGIKKRIQDCTQKTKKGDTVSMHYTGTLYESGEEFDSSIPRGEPLKFKLGAGQVIKGWDQGLIGMCAGEKRKIIIPSELGYGASGAPPKIPANAALVFEVELVEIVPSSDEL